MIHTIGFLTLFPLLGPFRPFFFYPSPPFKHLAFVNLVERSPRISIFPLVFWQKDPAVVLLFLPLRSSFSMAPATFYHIPISLSQIPFGFLPAAGFRMPFFLTFGPVVPISDIRFPLCVCPPSLTDFSVLLFIP